MTIVRCPRCRDEVTAPAKATGRALVRCPLCLEEYLLAEALSNAPPPLVIIGGEVEQAAIQSPSDADEYRIAGGPFSAGMLEATTAQAAATASPRPPVRTVARPRRKEKSGILLAVNYVGGGVLGLSLGLLVLWWVFRQDPLGAGPNVAAYAPWIVPTEFRGKSATENAADSDRPSMKISSSIEPQPVAGAETLQSLPGFDEPAKLPGATPPIETPSLGDPSDAVLPGRGDRANEANPPAAEAGELSAGPQPPMPDLTDLLPDGPPAVVALPGDDRRALSAVELADAVTAAAAALEHYDELPKDDGEGRRQAFVDLHNAAGEVGRLLSYRQPADAASSTATSELERLLASVASKKGTLNAAKYLTAQQWPELADGRGLLAAGTVKRFQSAGRLFEVTLEASIRDAVQTLPVVTGLNPRDLCDVGDELVVVGRVVDDPKLNLPGYDGERSRVLSAGFALRVPKAE